uniref:O-fucosyltransferase family protein n=1 Tax=Anthurium amnicola TaxID=1678845 RepID=A0A1D1XNQ2_9ARAE
MSLLLLPVVFASITPLCNSADFTGEDEKKGSGEDGGGGEEEKRRTQTDEEEQRRGRAVPMQRRRLSVGSLSLLRWVLTCAIGAIALGALVVFHVFPSSEVPALSDAYRLPKQRELGYHGWSGELSWTQEFAPPQLAKVPPSSQKLDGINKLSVPKKLWKQPSSRDFMPCVEPSSSYYPHLEMHGYLLVHTNGGLNQMRAGISDMVAVAHIINATLVIPELDKRSFWQDSSNFSDVFDEEHFIHSLENDINIIKKLPKELATATKAVKHFRSWSGVEYYQDEISQLWNDYQVIRAAKSDSRLSNNNLPIDIQKLRCRAFYEALQFAPRIKAFGKLLVERMRSYGPYIALHLRYEKDMLAFSGCTYGLSTDEANELTGIRENTAHWIVKDIDPVEQRVKGHCPLTPMEVGIFLSGLGYPSHTPVYIAAGEIYGGDSRMADLQARFPKLMSKEKLASPEELESFTQYASQMAALDYIVSVESDVFVPSYSGNMARAVAGHRRFLGHRKTITPDRKALVHLLDKIEEGKLQDGEKISNMIVEIHRKRQGSPRKRKGPVSGTKGKERFRSEESFYENPLPECLCRREIPVTNSSLANT